jgi:hypothetical protein
LGDAVRTARSFVIGTVTALAVGLGAVPAAAAPTGDTTVTFGITAGALDITVPASKALGNVAPGNAASAQLGAVTVTDLRAQANAAWTASVISTDFAGSGTAAGETIPATAVSYWSGPATSTTGTGTRTPGQAAVGNAVAIDTSETAFALTAGTGNSITEWNPTLIVQTPTDALAGTYTGTVTHSVA